MLSRWLSYWKFYSVMVRVLLAHPSKYEILLEVFQSTWTQYHLLLTALDHTTTNVITDLTSTHSNHPRQAYSSNNVWFIIVLAVWLCFAQHTHTHLCCTAAPANTAEDITGWAMLKTSTSIRRTAQGTISSRANTGSCLWCSSCYQAHFHGAESCMFHIALKCTLNRANATGWHLGLDDCCSNV